MRVASVTVVLLWLCSGVPLARADPPPAKSTPAPANPAPPSAPTPGAKPAPGQPSGGDKEAVTEPDRIDPTEKVHSDSEISFPVDI